MRPLTIALIIIIICPLIGFFDLPVDTTPRLGVNQIEEVNLQTPDFQVAEVNDEVNRAPNGNFEEWALVNKPSLYDVWEKEERYHWYAESPWPVKTGNRSLGIQARMVEPFDGDDGMATYPEMPSAEWGASFYTDTTIDNLILSLDWWIDHNMYNFTDGDAVVLQLLLRLSNGVGVEYSTLNYHLSCAIILDYGGIQVAGNHLQWNLLNRNITEDFITAGGNSEFIDEHLESVGVNFQVYLSGDSHHYVRALFDNLQIGNGTYQVVNGSVNNGNFETDSVWSSPPNHDISIVNRSPVATSGDWSLNLTVESKGNDTGVSLRGLPGVRITNQSACPLHLDWRLENLRALDSLTYAYLYIKCHNYSDSVSPFATYNLYYLLSYGGDTSPFTNSTEDLVILVSEFNTTGLWNSLDRVLFYDIFDYFGSNDSYIYELYFKVFSSDPRARISLLLDDFSILSEVINDGRFEDQGVVGSPVHGWGQPGWPLFQYEQPLATVTDLAYEGNNAFNISFADGVHGGMATTTAYLEITESSPVYLELAWRLEEFEVTDTCYVGVGIGLWNPSRTGASSNIGGVAYIMGSYAWNPISYSGFAAEESNTTGTWIHMRRNLYQDLDALGLWSYYDKLFTSDIQFGVFTSAGCSVQLLLDNISLYSNQIPEITHYEHESEEAGLPTIVRATVAEDDLQSVVLHYSIDGGDYVDVIMDHEVGDDYTAVIPGQFHGTQIDYYISAHDIFGAIVDTRILLYYTPFPDPKPIYSVETFFAIDTSPPTFSLLNPTSGVVYSGIVSVQVSAQDSGSGISQWVVGLGMSVLYTSSDPTDTFSWDTTEYEDGEYTLVVVVTNGAGLESSTSVLVTISNPEVPEGPPMGDVLLLFGGTAVAVIIMVLVYKIRR